jgi:cytochrome bd ubiquinol oxidase subunit I
MMWTALLLSRVQFAFTVSFHIIFPSFTIGLAAWLTVLETFHLFTGKPVYRRVFEFWLRIFGVTFGLGVVSGIVLAFEFGMNWSRLSEVTGPIQGPLLIYESFTAFALEASFFGVLIFGRSRVPPLVYLFSTMMVALGTTFSAFWIMVNNSWMQVPVGYVVENGQFVPDDWTKIIFNSVVWSRFPHMLLASYLTGAFCVAASGAWYLLRYKCHAEAMVMLRMGLFSPRCWSRFSSCSATWSGTMSTNFSPRSSQRSRAVGTTSSLRARCCWRGPMRRTRPTGTKSRFRCLEVLSEA